LKLDPVLTPDDDIIGIGIELEVSQQVQLDQFV